MLERIEKDWRRAGLDARREAILAYAEKLTLQPASLVEEDLHALRRVGLADVDILHLAQCVAYFAFVNRIADGLGVSVEPTFKP